MNPVMSSETIRIVHDAMIREQAARQRRVPAQSFRHNVAAVLFALGARLDPSVRRPASAAAPFPRLRAA